MSAPDQLMVQPGMTVYSADAEYIGRVQGVDGPRFTVEHDDGGRTVMPRDAVAGVSETDHRVDLRLTLAEVETFAGSSG